MINTGLNACNNCIDDIGNDGYFPVCGDKCSVFERNEKSILEMLEIERKKRSNKFIKDLDGELFSDEELRRVLNINTI